MPKIISIKTAFPTKYFSQNEVLDGLSGIWRKHFHNFERIQEIFSNAGVEGRHLVLDLVKYQELNGHKDRNQYFIKESLDLASRVLNELFIETETFAQTIGPGDIDFFQSNSITGIMVPSIEARLCNRFAFPTWVKRLPIFGLGCLAGAAGLNRLSDYLQAFPKQAGIFLSVELCSLTFRPKDVSPANIISSSLFGDGAGVVLMVGDMHPLAQLPGLRHLGGGSKIFHNTERVMGWDVEDDGLAIVLSKDVAEVAKENIPELTRQFLPQMMPQQDVSFVLSHPGGPKVLAGMQAGLDSIDSIGDEAKSFLQLSRESLAQKGNMSSVSIMHIMQKFFEHTQTSQGRELEGKSGLYYALGPGFCAEIGALRVE